jgi:protein-arginine kinase activator protein McsA
MAVRFDCPIFTYDFILEAAGVVLDEQEGGYSSVSVTTPTLDDSSFENWPVDTLKNRLQEVLDAEDYETAARIRDELKRREAKG